VSDEDKDEAPPPRLMTMPDESVGNLGQIRKAPPMGNFGTTRIWRPAKSDDERSDRPQDGARQLRDGEPGADPGTEGGGPRPRPPRSELRKPAGSPTLKLKKIWAMASGKSTQALQGTWLAGILFL
jgi:hypothetical protein